MTYKRAMGIAIGCVMASNMDMKEKVEAVRVLKEIEQLLENLEDDKK